MRPSVPTGFAMGSNPNTRTVPDCGRSSPSTCLISVVLPAPLPPISPNTPPRGMDSETSSSAVLSPNRLVTRCSSITELVGVMGASMVSFLRGSSRREQIAPLLDQLEHVFDRDIHLLSFGQQRVDPLRENLDPLPPREWRALLGDIRSGRPPLLNHAEPFEFSIGSGYGVGIDDE